MQYVAGLLFLMGGESLLLLPLKSAQSASLAGEVLLKVKITLAWGVTPVLLGWEQTFCMTNGFSEL